MNGKLIAIEGIDGAGKSTLIKYVSEKLKESNIPTVVINTREEKQENLFNLIIQQYHLKNDSSAYMFFFQMLHACKVERVKKALNDGNIVIADRWDFSFFVYHQNFGFLSKESNQLLKDISRLAFNDLRPDLGIYLDVKLEKAIDRRLWRGETLSDIKKEKKMYKIIQKSYKKLAINQCWEIVDANQDFETTKNIVFKTIKETIKNSPKKYI